MKRRKFTIGLGALATGGATAIGTGAFTSVEAERRIRIDVADDANSFLELTGDDDYVTNDNEDGSITVDLGGPETDNDGQGFNERARSLVPDVVSVGNQGSQNINLGFGNTPSLTQQFAFPGDGDNNPSLVTLSVEGDAEGQDEIEPGETMSISVEVNNRDDVVDDSELDPGAETQAVELTAFEPDEFPDFPDEDDDDGGVG